MKMYEIELDEAVFNFYEEIAIVVERPVEEILSDTLFKYVEIINRKVFDSSVASNETVS